jgi:hypothetical protein
MLDDGRDPLAERLGEREAADLREHLAALGLAVVDVEELSDLERRAEAYDRMRRLVDGP